MSKFIKPKKFQYNLVVLGAGSGGLVASYIAATVKAKVALIEKNAMGGDCLNTGCVPSKALIRSAKAVNEFKKASKLGIDGAKYKVNFKKVMEGVKQAIKKIAPNDSVERYSKLGVECFEGEGKILSPWEVEVTLKNKTKMVLTTKSIILATGASPFVPPIPNLKKVKYLTSDNLWGIKELPKKLVVLGGGPIGSELAQAFARLGSKVTQIEMMNRIIKVEDQEVSALLEEEFKKDGVSVLTNHQVIGFATANSLIVEYFDHTGKAKTKKINFDKILIAVGRKPNLKNYGLEKLKIKTRKNGTVKANDFMQTNYPNIFVCGDITGPYQFTHIASHQAWFAAVNALFGKIKKFKVDYSVIPWCTYTDPEIARVGINEQEAREQGIRFEATTFPLEELDRAITDRSNIGFIKVITPKNSDKILGATVAHAQASTMILEFVAAMKNGFGLNKILSTIHIYPSLGEANKYVAGHWKRKNVNPIIYSLVKKYQDWMRS